MQEWKLHDIRSDYQIADSAFYVLETPGLCRRSLYRLFLDHLVLYPVTPFFIGRMESSNRNAAQLLSSIKRRTLYLPSSYTVYPGHGPETSIGHEDVQSLL